MMLPSLLLSCVEHSLMCWGCKVAQGLPYGVEGSLFLNTRDFFFLQ